MLLLGHPRLGAQKADIYSTKWAGCRKTLAPEGMAPAGGGSYPGAWKIDIRPEIPLRPAKSRPRALLFGSGGLQERSKRLSRGLPSTFSVDAAIRTPFWSRLGLEKEALGP